MLASGRGPIERLRQIPTIWRVLPALLAAVALAGAAVRWQSFNTVWLAASGSGMPRGLGGRRRLPSAPQAPLAAINDLQINAPLGTDGKLSGPLLDRLVIFARWNEAIDFLEELQDIPYLVYQDHNSSAYLQTPPGAGVGEAPAYLKFIVDNYDRLPDRVVFAHAHRTAWHHTIDVVGQLKLLRWKDAPPFANLRALDVNMWQSSLWPNNISMCNNHDIVESAQTLAKLWKDSVALHINGTANADPPDLISAPCCAEFEVSAARILARPLQLYVDMLAWSAAQDSDDDEFYRGRAFEYIWHIIFGEPAVTGAVDECVLYKCTEGYYDVAQAPASGEWERQAAANKSMVTDAAAEMVASGAASGGKG